MTYLTLACVRIEYFHYEFPSLACYVQEGVQSPEELNSVQLKGKRDYCFEQDACTAKVRPHKLLTIYYGGFTHAVRRLDDQSLCKKASLVAALNHAEGDLNQFLYLFPSIKDFVGKHNARTRTSDSKLVSTIIEFVRNVQNELYNIISGRFVPDDQPFDFRPVFPPRQKFVLSWIVTALEDGSSAVPASNEIQFVSLLRLRMDSKTLPNWSTNFRYPRCEPGQMLRRRPRTV